MAQVAAGSWEPRPSAPIAATSSSTTFLPGSVSRWGQGSFLSSFAAQPLLRLLGSASQACRFLSTIGGASSKSQVQVAADVLQHIHVAKLRELLEDEAMSHVHIPLSRLEHLCLVSGAATTEADILEMTSSLHKAGIILKHNDTVYLRPLEIAEIVMQVLPGGREEAQSKLTQVEAELEELEKQRARLSKSAERLTTLFLASGCFILAFQLVAFIYLTWWELSWDVMEPIAYIISLFYSLVGYMYFLVTRGKEFDLGPFREYWSTKLKNKKLQQLKFNEERYQYLLKLQQRYKRQLAQIALRT